MSKRLLIASLLLSTSLSSFGADIALDTVNCNPYGQVVVRSHTGATWPARAYQGSWNSSANNGGIRCTFTIPADGTYKLWGRMIADDGIQPYAIDMDNDGGNEGTWNTVSGAANNFQWFDSGVSKFYSAGQYKLNLTLLAGEDNTRLDYLQLTSDMSYTPSGEGQAETPQYDDYDFQSNVVSTNGHLHASNGKLYNEHSQEIQLQGIGLHGLQWFPTRERNTIPHMVEEWGAELVRLAMYIEKFPSDLTTYASDDYWGGWSSDPDRQQYMEEQVDRIVKEAVKAGIYVQLTWHIHDDPTRWQSEAVDFFGRMSEKYGMLPNVIFEPCNEPLGRDWSGTNSIRSFATAVINEIRARDPDGIDNIVIVGTPFYSANIQDVTTGDGLLDDPNVAYSLHHYAFSHDETAKINDAVNVKNAGGLPWLSEWSPASYNITDIDLIQGADLVNKMNEHMFSSTVWSMSNKIETSSLLDGNANMWGPWTWGDLSQVGQWFKDNSQFSPDRQFTYHFDAAVACASNCITDNDNDGVIDQYWDQCLATPAGATVDEHGCNTATADSDGDGYFDADDDFPDDASENTDSDNDGMGDNADQCDSTPSNVDIDANGCYVFIDDDNDNVPNYRDSCANTAVGATVNADGCAIASGNHEETLEAEINIGANGDYQSTFLSSMGDNKFVEWSVNLPATGTYSIEIAHSGWGSGEAELQQNGVSVGSLGMLGNTNSWGADFQIKTVELPLSAGTSTIRFEGISGSNYELDYIKLSIAGSGSAESNDLDHDGVLNGDDQCPGTSIGELVDSLGCALSDDGNNDNSTSNDSDNDGVNDQSDICANTPSNESANASGCSPSQLDSDNDGVNDNVDSCSNTPSSETANANGCSASQVDSDNDGIYDNADNCANTPSSETANTNGCSPSQLDSDNDGVNDNVDTCSNTPSSETANTSGCSASQVDSDNDGVYDNADNCANTPSSETANTNGCSPSQIDSDNDGVNDNVDSCSNTPSSETANSNGCSASQVDSDSDGVYDNADNCANTPAGDNVDELGCTITESGQCDASNSTIATGTPVVPGDCIGYNVQSGNLQLGTWNGGVVVSITGGPQNVNIPNQAFTQVNTGTGWVYFKIVSGSSTSLQTASW